MIRPRGRDLPVRRAAIDGILDENFPAVGALLEGVEVEGDEVVEEVAFHLAAEDVDFAAEDVEGVTVAARWPRTGW